MRFFNKDYIYLVWQNPKTRSKTVVGLLKRNGRYEFKYTNDAKKAIKEGFQLLLAFPKIDKKYTNIYYILSYPYVKRPAPECADPVTNKRTVRFLILSCPLIFFVSLAFGKSGFYAASSESMPRDVFLDSSEI